jgi:TolB-like protein
VKGYLKPGVAVSHIRSLAVLPFDNISGHPDAGKKVVNLLLTELARTELFQIADVGEVEKSLRRLRIRTTAEIDLSKLQDLGEQLHVQVVIVGSVDEYEVRPVRNGTVPIVAINARMLEAQTGDILWAISHTHDGNDWETVFGFGRIISLSQLAQIVVSEMVESLVRELLEN